MATTNRGYLTRPAAADEGTPVRVLVRTETQLVPGDKSRTYGARVVGMQNLICQHVWQRNHHPWSERAWDHKCEFMIDNLECWFLIDHYGPDPAPDLDPPVLWYTWTGTRFIAVQDPLPRRVRRELRRYYPFKRWGPDVELEEDMKTQRKSRSPAEKMRACREHLRSTLAYGPGLPMLDKHVQFVKEHPDQAEWVKARLPPVAWERFEIFMRSGKQ